MGLLKPLGAGQGYLKAGFLGFQKSGKTYTAALLAIGVRKHLGAKGPIAMFDTEGGSEYIAEMVRKATGTDLLGVQSRSFTDLMTTAAEVEKAGCSVLIADSMTHPWRELCDSALKQINERMKARADERGYNFKPRMALEFQDWGPIKARWATWTDWYLNSKMHVIICGRAGWEYDHEESQDGGKKQLVKVGTKMKTEAEFGFEPSLLVEMERVQEIGDKAKLVHRATILGDRYNVIDGKQKDNPGFEFFKPHVEKLTPGAHAPVDTAVKTDLGLDADGADDWAREKKTREILTEELASILDRVFDTTAAGKKARAEWCEKELKTASKTAIEIKPSAELRKAKEAARQLLLDKKQGLAEAANA